MSKQPIKHAPGVLCLVVGDTYNSGKTVTIIRRMDSDGFYRCGCGVLGLFLRSEWDHTVWEVSGSGLSCGRANNLTTGLFQQSKLIPIAGDDIDTSETKKQPITIESLL